MTAVEPERRPRPASIGTQPSRVYRPALAVTVLTVGVLAVGVRGLGLGRPLVQLITDGWARMLGPAVLGFVAAVLLLERVRPAVRRPLLARGHVQDFAYLVLYAAAVVPVIVVLDLGFSETLEHVAPWLTIPRMAVVPRLAMLSVAVLLMDGCNWMAHWANHRWNAVWRFHAVHHSQEELSILTSFRAHPLVHTSFLISVLPVVVLSSNAALPATVITVYICLSSLPHANLRWTFGPLGRIIVSPAYHRLHHASEGRIDINLGTLFTFWDVLTRRAVFPVPGAAPIVTGLDRRPVPVEQERPRRDALAVLGVQLAEPFLVPADAGVVTPSRAGAVVDPSVSPPPSPSSEVRPSS